jgi:NIMA (never in mitosis gene a)-related kinase
VCKIRRKSDGRVMVWKELNYGKMGEKEKQQLVAEVNILRELNHPHIVRYYDRIIDKQNAKIYIIMEYCEKGDLAQIIKGCRQ